LLKKEKVLAMAHVTGGGFTDNLPRVLPAGCGVKIHVGSWPVPRVFRWVQEAGHVTPKEMFRTFNMGIGFVLVVPRERAVSSIRVLKAQGERAWLIGDIVKGEGVTIQ
jgi:phosphoribosylformylglycinamidine cyclo-ligase